MDGAAPDPLVGLILDGKYRLDARLGEGGMGAVYRGVHLAMAKAVAVKLLRPQLARDPKAARRFQREARSASMLDDPRCLRVTDFGDSEGRSYLVMELLDGRPLSAELGDRRTIAPGRAAKITREIALALAHAHAQGLVHRDLKPDNVFLVRDDAVKVLDFGLAKLFEDEDKPGSLTEAGMVFGTPEFMSPEQAQGLPLGPRSDLYALGVVLFQMLCGELPFVGATHMDTLLAHLGKPVPSPAERRPDLALPPALVALTMRLLAKDPAARPASAEDLADILATLDLSPPAARVPRELASKPTVELTPPAPPAVASLEAELAPPPARVVSGKLVIAVIATFTIAGAWFFIRTRVEKTQALAALLAPDAAPSRTASAPAATPTPAAAPPDAAPAPASSTPPVATVDKVTPLLRRADAARRAGNRIQEVVRLQEVLDLDARHPAANLRLAEIAVDSNELTLACRHLDAARGLRSHKGAHTLRERAGCRPPPP